MMNKSDPEVKEFLKHFDTGFSPEIVDYATNVMLKESRYIFVTTVKRQQYGYCTHCYSEFKTHLPKPPKKQIEELQYCGCSAAIYMDPAYEKRKHGETMQCPVCGSTCKVRYSGVGHSNLRDEAYFVYYEKSLIDPKAIVARGIAAWRSYVSDFKSVKTNLSVDYWYLFEANKGGKMLREQYVWNKGYGLYFTKTVRSRINCQSNGTYVAYCRPSIDAAVKGTPFAWSGWENFDALDMTTFFDLYARYPVVEYLVKLGYKKLIKDKLNNVSTRSTINWRGKTPSKVFRLSDDEYSVIKQHKNDVTFWFLYMFKKCKAMDTGMSLADIILLSEKVDSDHEFDLLKEMVTKRFTLKDSLHYAIKQLTLNKSQYYSIYSLVRDWKDYISDCKKLGLDIEDIKTLYPRDLNRTHQNTSQQIKFAQNKAIDEKIEQRLPELQRYKYEANGIFIRPVLSTQELIDEGKTLCHCVGTYSDRYAKGETTILLVRKVIEPDTPFYTMEVRGTTIYQTRGLRNCQPSEEVQAFIEAYKVNILKKIDKQAKKKDKVPA